MRSSSIYNYIRRYLAPIEPKYQAKKTRATGRKYFKYSLSVSDPTLALDGGNYHIVNQHISVYSTYNDNMPGLEAYHLTINARQGATDFIIHCYFRFDGTMTVVTMRQNEEFLTLSENDQSKLQTYAIETSSLILSLSTQLLDKQAELQDIIRKKELEAEKISKDLSRHLSSYITSLRELISVVNEFNIIFNNSMAGKHRILEQILSVSEQRSVSSKKIAKHKKVRVPTESKTSMSETKAGASSSSSSSSSLSTPTDGIDTLETINKKFAALKGGDLSTLEAQKELLEKKLKLIPASDLNVLAATLQQLYKLTDEIPKSRLATALSGNVVAAREIVDNNDFVPVSDFHQLVFDGKAEVFDILFLDSPFRMILKHSSGGFAVSKDGKHTLKGLLEIAYKQNHVDFFRKLLFEHHFDPRSRDPITGEELVHTVAMNGNINYMQILFDAGANISVLNSKPKGHIFMGAAETKETSVLVKKSIKDAKAYASDIYRAEEKKYTPLMLAACHSRVEMVHWLLDHKADTRVCGYLGLDAIGACMATIGKIEPLDEGKPITQIFEALVAAGMSTDPVNTISDTQQSSPLHYRCQNLDYLNVEKLVMRFACDPNVRVCKPMSSGVLVYIDCLNVALFKAFSAELKCDREDAVKIINFLLIQDIKPLDEQSLSGALQSYELFENSMASLTQKEVKKLLAAANEAKLLLNNHEYDSYCFLMQKGISDYSCEIKQAIYKTMLKQSLIDAAKEDLANKNYQYCINACQTILRAKFNIQQYNESLWHVYYQAYLGLGDDENAANALEHYLKILVEKSEQVFTPAYRAEVNKKIAKASEILTQVHERLMATAATAPPRLPRVTFFATSAAKGRALIAPGELKMKGPGQCD